MLFGLRDDPTRVKLLVLANFACTRVLRSAIDRLLRAKQISVPWWIREHMRRKLLGC
ncbi:hypothetical protein LG293_04115 [Citricoccus nitrophenolicus]